MMAVKRESRLSFAFRIAFCTIIWVIVSISLSLALSGMLDHMYGAWGVTTSNISQAPSWLKALTSTDESIVSLISNLLAASITICTAQKMLPVTDEPVRHSRRLLVSLLTILVGLAAGFLCIALDAARLAWPLTEPRLTYVSILSGLATFSGAMSRTILLIRVLYAPLAAKKLHKTAALLTAGLAICFNLPVLHWSVLIIPALSILAACAIYDRFGLADAILLMCSWTISVDWLIAWPDRGNNTVYKLYTVSERWLPGLLGSFLWIAILLWIYRRSWRQILQRARRGHTHVDRK